MQALFDYLKSLFESLLDWLLLWPKQVFYWFMDMIATWFELNDVPEFITGLWEAFGNIPSDIDGLITAVGFYDAFAIIIAAYAIRTVLRLIPLVRLGN